MLGCRSGVRCSGTCGRRACTSSDPPDPSPSRCALDPASESTPGRSLSASDSRSRFGPPLALLQDEGLFLERPWSVAGIGGRAKDVGSGPSLRNPLGGGHAPKISPYDFLPPYKNVPQGGHAPPNPPLSDGLALDVAGGAARKLSSPVQNHRGGHPHFLACRRKHSPPPTYWAETHLNWSPLSGHLRTGHLGTDFGGQGHLWTGTVADGLLWTDRCGQGNLLLPECSAGPS